MKHFQLYIFDLDGTLYRGHQPIPYAVEVVRTVKGRGAQVRFLTNNSGQTRAAQAVKLSKMGFEVEQGEILTSAFVAARTCIELKLDRIFLLGEPGMFQTFEEAGVIVDQSSEEVDAVVVGICRTFTYSMLNTAMQRLLKGAKFYATNLDASYPLADGIVEPGAGSIVAAVSTASGQMPHVIGKPNPDMILEILHETGVSASETLVIGDRVDTDIHAGLAAGCQAHLVLTGVTSSVSDLDGFTHSLDLRGIL